MSDSVTRGAAIRAVCVKLALAVAFAVIGVWVVSLAIDMVGAFGEGMGVDAASKHVYSRAHIAVHIFGTASSIAVGFFIMDRSKTLAFLAIVVIILCGGYGVTNMIGFTTTNRLVVSEVKTASNTADERKYMNARADLEKSIEWAQKSASQEEGREKKRLLAYIDEKRKELSALQPPKATAETVLADPQATWFARLTGSSTQTWQLALPVPVAILLFAAEVLSFVFAVHFGASAVEGLLSLPANIPKETKNKDDDQGGAEGGGSGGDGKKLHIVASNAIPKPTSAAGALAAEYSVETQNILAEVENIPASAAPAAEYSAVEPEYAGPAETQRSAPSVPSSGAKKSPQITRAELGDRLHKHAMDGHWPTQDVIASETGWSQPTVCRDLEKAIKRAEQTKARVKRKADKAAGKAQNIPEVDWGKRFAGLTPGHA